MDAARSRYTVEIDDVDEPAWSALLERFADATLYQTWHYGAHQYGKNHLTHVVVKQGDRVVAAAQGMIMKVPGVKLGIAHFPWGPMWRVRDATIDPAVLQHALKALFEHYACKCGLMVRIRSYEAEEASNEESLFPLFTHEGFRHCPECHYQTMRLDLSPSIEQLRKNSSSRWRRHLRAAEKKQLTVHEGSSDELFDKFIRLYEEMYARKHIVGYNPNIKCFRSIQHELPDHLKMVVLLCEYEGEAVTANVLSPMGDTGMYFFGATSDKAIKENIRASYLLHWRTIEWLKDHGYRWYDLRGYDAKLYPGVSHFKAGLNGEIVKYAEFIGCRNRLSEVTVTSAERIVDLARTAKGRVSGTRNKVTDGSRAA
jgi:lipid II:glycine glycyltransferase (peptidoglycan interpeptide bridge formation enzyme)